MKKRCYSPDDVSYQYYGARGITVCQRWLDSFDNFMDDMGSKPTIKHSLDRIDNEGNYEPLNCRWADDFQQNSKRRGLTSLTFRGETKTQSAWAREFGMKFTTLRMRLEYGWPIERALIEKVRPYCDGSHKTVKDG